jgi:ABC-type phosphate transport system permease subunit
MIPEPATEPAEDFRGALSLVAAAVGAPVVRKGPQHLRRAMMAIAATAWNATMAVAVKRTSTTTISAIAD